ncbi:hypothetical protein F4780DRAFT_709997 [Xylariomycetidae sp. FL0641]|nr:hypothetical protein F4780DRAFT_709997 [Xylariomycetidae sp. FL0641]
MASHFQVQKPYVLTTLPRPLDPITGRYVVGEVYGSEPGSRKRKRRPELTVGIDGEAINIYDVSSARLVTSYPIPPQSSISCPITSFRRRIPGKKEVARYTYVAIDGSSAPKLSLFKDDVDASGKTTSTTLSVTLGQGAPVVCVTPLFVPDASPESEHKFAPEELLAIKEDGKVISLDLESLQQRWTSNATFLQQDLSRANKQNFKIELCRRSTVSDVSRGTFGDSGTASSLFSAGQAPADDAEVLLILSSSGPAKTPSRHLHIVGLLQTPNDTSLAPKGLVQHHVLPIPTAPTKNAPKTAYHLDVRSGSLLELNGETLIIYDLTASIPRVASTAELKETTSFLHLSKTSVLYSTNAALNVYNPVYKSLQDTVAIDLDGQGQVATDSETTAASCRLVSYFSKLELAIAIVDSNLVAVQLEAPVTRRTKRRAEGLLIDSIGRGIHNAKRVAASSAQQPPRKSVFSNYLPGSIRGDYWEIWTAEEAKADSLLNANDIYGLEMFLADKFGIAATETRVADSSEDESLSKPFPTWHFPKTRTGYPQADRRWILYAISRAFQWNDALPDDPTVPRLICQLPQSNVVNYLVDAGHLTLSNLRAAFRGKLSDKEQEDEFLAGQLIARLADANPSLELLVVYLSATSLGVIELLLVVRTIMRSFELVQDPKKPPPKLLMSGSADEQVNGEETANNENIGMELDDLEDEIQKTVSYLNEDAGVRGNGLSVAFAKLGGCPGISMVRALRSLYRPEEILSLIYLLRVELVKGAWTSRYLDDTDFEKDAAFDAPPDGIIKLLADLMGRCVDSIGAGGWLLNDAILAGDDTSDFISNLKNEVSAALEGLEQAVYLRGVVGEAVKYSESARKAVAEGADTSKPISVRVRERGDEALPLGLKSAEETISKTKVTSGGEIVERSQRETGHLVSQQVGSYSLERIAI